MHDCHRKSKDRGRENVWQIFNSILLTVKIFFGFNIHAGAVNLPWNFDFKRVKGACVLSVDSVGFEKWISLFKIFSGIQVVNNSLDL
jgi:hypothetical protein